MTRTEILHPAPRRDAATVVRSVTAAAWLLVRRRARRDIALLVVLFALVGSASLLATLSPLLVTGAVDRGARGAVAAAGADTDVVVHVAVGERSSMYSYTPPEEVVPLAAAIPARLPHGLKAVLSRSTLAIVSPDFAASAPGTALQLRVGMLTDENTAAITLVDGSLPAENTHGAIQVLVSHEAGLPVGTVITPTSSDDTFVVVGVVRSAATAAATEAAWRDMPTLFSPSASMTSSGKLSTNLTVLTSAAGVTRAEQVIADPWDGAIRLILDPAAFTGALEPQVANEINALRVSGGDLLGDSDATMEVSSKFTTALMAFPAEARAAVAQMSVMFAGMLGVAVIVVVLLSQLIVSRRSGELVLERARGASLVAIGFRASLEALIVVVLAASAGFVVALRLSPGAVDPLWAAVVALIAVGAIPVFSVLTTRASTAVQRVAANRGDRMDVVRRARTKRVVIEATLVAIAVGALVSLRSRGLLQTRTDGVDPLLAAAPLLLAVVITIVLLRVFPVVVHISAAVGRRSPGALGILGAAHAERAIAVLPLASLTLAVALAVGGGLLVDTVHSGQVDASWQRVGADARVTGDAAAASAAEVAAAPGVVAASLVLVADGVTVTSGATSSIVSVLAIDDRYAAVVSALPVGEGAGPSSVRALDRLGDDADVLPVVVDSTLADRLASSDLTMAYGTAYVNLHVVGTLDAGPDGWDSGPHVWVDLTALKRALPELAPPNTLLVVGPGADAAVAAIDGDVQTRSGWLADREHQPLGAGVRTIMATSVAASSLFAIIALLAGVLSSARSRGRSLALLRTLGMGSRLGWWLALAELAPVVVLAAIGGVLAGVAMIVVVGPSLGLQTLSGGLAEPRASLSPIVIFAVVGGLAALLGAALLTEAIVRRRDRLSEVLRVGETV